MKPEDKVASPAPGASWTRPEAYIGALARRRSYRRARDERPRSQPVTPQPWLSTVPFAAMLAALAILTIAIIFVAFPGTQPGPVARRATVHEQGVAPRGWLQEAQKDMHR